jgi:flagellar biosynthesis/type III secretory pathway protein FliH
MTLDKDAAAELAEEIRRRVAERIEEARRRRAANRRANAEKKARRAAGLKARHARKLNQIKKGTGRDDDR